MNETVYLVWSGNYKRNWVEAVFADEGDANAFADELRKQPHVYGVEVDAMEVQ